jgi:hypothetical protein
VESRAARAYLRQAEEAFRKANAEETAGMTAELDALAEADQPVHDP